MPFYLCMWSQIHNRAVKNWGRLLRNILTCLSFSNPANESELETWVFSWSFQFPSRADPEDILIRSIEQFERNLTVLFHDSFFHSMTCFIWLRNEKLIYINSTLLNVFRLVQVLRYSFIRMHGINVNLCFYPTHLFLGNISSKFIF